MTYKRFEDTPAWKDAIRLMKWVYTFAQTGHFRTLPGFRKQIGRAAVSISNNIAEGLERGGTNELIMFLYIAKGSAGEVRSMLRLFAEVVDPSPPVAELGDAIALADAIGRQLGAWIEYLKSCGLQGVRSQNEATRAVRARSRRGEAFLRDVVKPASDRAIQKLNEGRRSKEGGGSG